MQLLEANQITYYVRDRLLFHIKHLEIHKGEAIGLVGWNGCGKTTLLEILAEATLPDEGTIQRKDTCHLLPQLKGEHPTKSGGEITQAAINDAIAQKPSLLLADEPTTNLDTNHIEKLESTFKRWDGAMVIVSHDRAFLDTLCTRMWELDDGELKEYKGNYSDFKAQKDLEITQQQQAYESYVEKKKQLVHAIHLKDQQAKNATKLPKGVSNVEASKTSNSDFYNKKQKKLYQSRKSMETRIEQLEKVDKVFEYAPIKMDIPGAETLNGRTVLRLEDAKATVGKERILWKNASLEIKSGVKLAIIGANGSGKTTFIQKILRGDTGITVSPAAKIGYFSQNLDILKTDETILKNVQKTSSQNETLIRIVLARLRFFRDDVHKKISVLSGGERVKVAFAKIFVSDMNTLILDEPTNYLDTDTMEALEGLLRDYEGTILFVSHDRRFIDRIATSVLAIENQHLHLFEGTYKEYKNYEAPSADPAGDNLLVLETKISEVLGKLSVDPTEELDKEFQNLLKRKKELESQ